MKNYLSCENSVSIECIVITNHMNKLIKISFIDVNEKNKLDVTTLGSDESEFANSEIT